MYPSRKGRRLISEPQRGNTAIKHEKASGLKRKHWVPEWRHEEWAPLSPSRRQKVPGCRWQEEKKRQDKKRSWNPCLCFSCFCKDQAAGATVCNRRHSGSDSPLIRRRLRNNVTRTSHCLFPEACRNKTSKLRNPEPDWYKAPALETPFCKCLKKNNVRTALRSVHVPVSQLLPWKQ